MLAELSTKEISEAKQPNTMEGHVKVAQQGGSVARNARKELEKQTGKSAISPLNAKQALQKKNNSQLEITD